MEIQFKKSDFWLAVLAGELVAWLSLPTLKNLQILDILAKRGISLASFVPFWALFVPLGATAGLGVFYLTAKWKQRVGFFQLGKYGVIGVLNTFLNAGIFNFMIFVTDTASGIIVDAFLLIAFVVAVTNSFFWNKYWAFGEKRAEELKGEAVKFFAVSGAVALLNIAILHLIVNVIGAPLGVDVKIWANVGLGVTIITAFFGNFFGYKFIVFKK